MLQIANFGEAHEVLKTFIPQTSQREAYTLDRMVDLMEKLGNPQEKYKVIHIAGTSGKTSTAYYITSLLKSQGMKVGLTVSPHVDEVNERVQIGLKPLSEKTFCSNLSQFIGLVEKIGIKPTYFELLVAFAYWYFAKVKVDYAVVEVGLGGLLDGTNIVNRQDKFCVITDIGYDHISVLGDSIEGIAAQKAGIIRPYNTVFTYEQGNEVMGVFREVAEQQQAELHEVLPQKASELPKQLPLFQRRNWYLALNVARSVAKRDGLGSLTEQQLVESVSTYIPARMEVMEYGDKVLIMDSAHNAQKFNALIKSIRNRYPKQEVAVLASFVRSKDFRINGILGELLPFAAHLILTDFATSQDTIKTSKDPLKLVERCEELGYHEWEIERDSEKALKILLKRKEPILLITGSFYLLEQVRKVLFKNPELRT